MVLILARTLTEAQRHARNENIQFGKWAFVSNAVQLLDLDCRQHIIHRVGRWQDRQDTKDITIRLLTCKATVKDFR